MQLVRDENGRVTPSYPSARKRRKRGENLGTAVRRLLDEMDPDHGTKRYLVAKVLFRLAVEEGNVQALTQLTKLDIFSDHESRLRELEEGVNGVA